MEKTKPFELYACRSLNLRFEVPPDKFKTDDFIERMTHKSGTAYCYTHDPQKSDYHVHFDWNADEDDSVDLDITFHLPGVALKTGEKEPYAEGVVEWVGQFFKNESAHATIGSSFSYDLSERQSKFPLPMRLGQAIHQDFEAEVDGLSFNLPSKPNGIDGVFIMTDPSYLSAKLRGGIRIKFSDFNLVDVLKDMSLFALKFTEAKSSDLGEMQP